MEVANADRNEGSRLAIVGGRRRHGAVYFDRSLGPLVSVITAVFNARRSVADCIESVLRQNYTNLEFIIVDAGSIDGTVDVIRKYDNQIDVWLSEHDNGIFDAWNKGLKLATGEWIAFLGADDVYTPGAIGRYMEAAQLHPKAEFICSRAQLVHPAGYAPIFGGPWKWPTSARFMTSIHVGTMHKRSLFERYGEFDTSYRSAGDYDFLLRVGGKLQAAFIPDVTVKMSSGGASDSVSGLYEARQAKIRRGVRSPAMATWDLAILLARRNVRKVLLAVLPRRLRALVSVLAGRDGTGRQAR
jgi:glycosyltransferase involved in cell wall biosynthesis